MKKMLVKLVTASILCMSLTGVGYAAGDNGLNIYSVKIPDKIEKYVQDN